MNLLLDTHYLLWSAFETRHITPGARKLILNPEATLWFSTASIWEVALKRALNRPSFQVDAAVLRAGLLANGYQELGVVGRHVISLTALPPQHGDLFDRMLIAQAIAEGMRLLTADRRVAEYGGSCSDRLTLLLARRYRLSVYDTLNLELALRHQGDLATLDKALAAATQAEGILVI